MTPARSRRRALGALLRRRLGAILAFAALAAPSHAQSEAIQLSDEAVALARLDAMMELLVELRGTLDATQYDLDALGLELAVEDAEAITAWTQERIAFEPYAGLLRGPQGTLLGRAGNALDQATLLARLLGDAGYEARVARAALAPDEARRLLSLAGPPPEPGPPGDVEAMRDVLLRLGELLDVPATELTEALEATVAPEPVASRELLAELETSASRLEEALAYADVALGERADARWLEEARAYAWTQYRLSASQPWRDAHPTGYRPAEDLAPADTFAARIPEELLHRVRIEAWIERKQDDALVVEPVMRPWERPVANAVGVVLSYANAPNGFRPSTVGAFELDEVLAGTAFFAPYFGGTLADGAQVFDLDGRTVAPDVAGDVAAATFQSVAGRAEQAAGALGALGGGDDSEDPGDLVALVGHGLDITLVAPDGTETRHRRRLLDRIGDAARARGEIRIADDAPDAATALLGRHRISIVPGRVPAAYLLDRTIGRLLETRPFFEFVVRQMASPDPDAAIDPQLLDGGDAPLDHLLAHHLFDRPLAAAGTGPGYRPGPAVLVLSERLDPGGSGALARSVDIVSNPRRVLTAGEDGVPRADPAAALRRGVWETLLERELLRDAAGRVTAAADAEGPYRLLRPGDAVDEGMLGGHAEAAANLRADLERGFLVAVPVEAPTTGPAWWRIDPASGTALGVTFDGRGQSLIEYELQLLDYAATMMFAVKGLKDCDDMSGTAELCCLLKAHLNNVAGLGFGGVVRNMFGGGSALVFTLGTGVAGTNFVGGMGLTCEEFGAGA